jgi:hypothetical protein
MNGTSDFGMDAVLSEMKVELTADENLRRSSMVGRNGGGRGRKGRGK